MDNSSVPETTMAVGVPLMNAPFHNIENLLDLQTLFLLLYFFWNWEIFDVNAQATHGLKLSLQFHVCSLM
jgi:hypothetical protein